jgi:hypothetical protein
LASNSKNEKETLPETLQYFPTYVEQDCQIFLGAKYQNGETIFQMTTLYAPGP